MVTGEQNTLKWNCRGSAVIVDWRSQVWPWEFWLKQAGWLYHWRKRNESERPGYWKDHVCNYWTDQEEYDGQENEPHLLRNQREWSRYYWWNNIFSYNREVNKKVFWDESVIEDLKHIFWNGIINGVEELCHYGVVSLKKLFKIRLLQFVLLYLIHSEI